MKKGNDVNSTGNAREILLMEWSQWGGEVCGAKPGRFETSKNPLFHELGSKWVSKQANEWVQRSEASSAEQEKEWAVRANDQMDKRVTQYSQFLAVLPHCARNGQFFNQTPSIIVHDSFTPSRNHATNSIT